MGRGEKQITYLRKLNREVPPDGVCGLLRDLKSSRGMLFLISTWGNGRGMLAKSETKSRVLSQVQGTESAKLCSLSGTWDLSPS